MKIALSYWKRYDLVFKHFSSKKLFKKILGFAKKLGEPFTKKSNRGPKFKISPPEYAAYTVFEIITHNSHYRDMESDSELYVNKHIDHSTFGKNFQKTPYIYFLNMLEETSKLLENILGKVKVLIADSTGTHSHVYHDCELVDKKTRRKKRYKTHALVSSHPNAKAIYIRTGIGRNLRISDSEGAKRRSEKDSAKNCLFIADRGYDFEKVYKECHNKNIKANIKPQKYESNRSTKRNNAIKQYSENLYKEGRGVVESIFGGLSNKGLLNTKLRKDENINKHSLISMFRHNLYTLLRLQVGLNQLVCLINRQTLNIIFVLSRNYF